MNESSNMEITQSTDATAAVHRDRMLNYVICVYIPLVINVERFDQMVLVGGNQTEVQWTYHLIAINLICIKNVSFQLYLVVCVPFFPFAIRIELGWQC